MLLHAISMVSSVSCTNVCTIAVKIKYALEQIQIPLSKDFYLIICSSSDRSLEAGYRDSWGTTFIS